MGCCSAAASVRDEGNEKADNATHSNLDKARAALAQNREREKNRTARDYLGLALLTDYLSVNKEGSFLASGLEWRGGVTAPPGLPGSQ